MCANIRRQSKEAKGRLPIYSNTNCHSHCERTTAGSRKTRKEDCPSNKRCQICTDSVKMDAFLEEVRDITTTTATAAAAAAATAASNHGGTGGAGAGGASSDHDGGASTAGGGWADPQLGLPGSNRGGWADPLSLQFAIIGFNRPHSKPNVNSVSGAYLRPP